MFNKFKRTSTPINMDTVPSILMVTWNRREYLEKTLKNLLSDESDFRLYIWDNASEDGVSDIVSDLVDDRIVRRVRSPENVGQFVPWHWFLECAEGEIAGKIDDDILGDHGWMARFAAMIAAEERFGTLGGWVYQRSEWNEQLAAHKIRRVGSYGIFENLSVGGCIFLSRKKTLARFSTRDRRRLGVPIDQIAMVRKGLINGYPFPISFAENLDDPRSPHCRMNRPGGWDQYAAYSARVRGFKNPEQYGRWIANDARETLTTPVSVQLRERGGGILDRGRNLLRGVRSKVRDRAKAGLIRAFFGAR